jgi:hypothetical protein
VLQQKYTLWHKAVPLDLFCSILWRVWPPACYHICYFNLNIKN